MLLCKSIQLLHHSREQEGAHLGAEGNLWRFEWVFSWKAQFEAKFAPLVGRALLPSEVTRA